MVYLDEIYKLQKSGVNTMSSTKIMTGHCYCGAIKFETSGDPVNVSHCHCESCRRHTGSAMITFASFRPEDIKFTGNQPTKFTTDDTVSRGFCSRCGSPISYESGRNEYVFLYAGIFDEPGELNPEVHMMYSEKIDWMKIEDGLPHSTEFLPPGL